MTGRACAAATLRATQSISKSTARQVEKDFDRKASEQVYTDAQVVAFDAAASRYAETMRTILNE